MFTSYLLILNVLALLMFLEPVSSQELFQGTSSHATVFEQDSFKKNAFKVLDEKCNVCHVSRKRVQNFTLQNMDSLASQINTQVFIKEKMPKGNKVVLSKSEMETLKLWLKNLGEK